MISALWLLTLIPAVCLAFAICVLLVMSEKNTRIVLDGLQKPVWAVKAKPCGCGETIMHPDFTGTWWQCAGCGKRLEEEA
jgi:hypothetical protein